MVIQTVYTINEVYSYCVLLIGELMQFCCAFRLIYNIISQHGCEYLYLYIYIDNV